MKLSISHQEHYSRSELLLRSIFGLIYIVLPHTLILFFLGIWGSILSAIAFWVILFTGRYPKSMFEYQVQLLRWQLRLNARIYNLSDDYPPFLLTDLFHTTVSTAFDRSYEKEADQFALNLLEEAKISPTAMASFF